MTTCMTCGVSYADIFNNERENFNVCDVCKDRLTDKVVPPLFKLTDRSRLPKAQLEKVLAWRPDNRTGMILVGPSGSGKTRCMWELVKHHGIINAEFFDCVSFGHRMTRKYRENTAEDWLDYIGCSAPLVLFDDLGKLKLTERVESEIFGVIDRRCANMLPIIATTQLNGSDMSGMMSPNRGEAMIRRLREFCEIVEF